MSERIAIVGASVRAAAASAVRAGFEVAAADLFADEDLGRITSATQIRDYPEGLFRWLQELAPAPAAWMYTGALENHPELVDRMARIAPLWGNGGDTLREVRSPWRLHAMLQSEGLRFPETRHSADGLPRDGSWLVKTGRGGSGSGVAALLGDATPPTEAFVQQRIVGIPCSAVYVATAGKSQLMGIVRQLIGESWLHANAFQYCGCIGPWPVSAALRAEIYRIGEVIASALQLRGIFGVDLMLDGEDVWTIEVNPRYPASSEILERANEFHLLAAHVAACRSNLLPDFHAVTDGLLHAKAVLFARATIAYNERMSIETVGSASATAWPALSDLPRVGTRIETAHPVLTLFANGATTDEVVSNLKARVAIVEKQLYVD